MSTYEFQSSFHRRYFQEFCCNSFYFLSSLIYICWEQRPQLLHMIWTIDLKAARIFTKFDVQLTQKTYINGAQQKYVFNILIFFYLKSFSTQTTLHKFGYTVLICTFSLIMQNSRYMAAKVWVDVSICKKRIFWQLMRVCNRFLLKLALLQASESKSTKLINIFLNKDLPNLIVNFINVNIIILYVIVNTYIIGKTLAFIIIQ